MKDELVSQIAAKAVIFDKDGKILILREADYAEGTNKGKYHVPGGRLEKGETYWEGLEREVMEETGLEVEPLFPLHIDEWRPVIKGVPHHIIAVFTLCRLKGTGKVRISQEHDEAIWIDPAKKKDYALLPPEAKALDAYSERGRQYVLK